MERTILLVDDEVEIGAALARILRRDSYKILRAKNGKEGLALLAEHDVGVVLSDQRMPEMTGVEFLSQVKELYPQTIRIILSGYADLEVVMDAINRGAIYKFFTKPWDSEALCAEVLEAFRHYELLLEKEGLMKEIQLANDMLAQVNMEMAAAVAQRDMQIEHISHYSRQTNLPNRQLFIERVEQDLTRSQQSDHMVAIIFINLDRFKQINDSFGHPLGDVVLQIVAERLKKHTRAGDTVAHLGGDEFGFLLPNMISVKAAADVAQKMIDSFGHEPISVGDSVIFVSVCLGISLYPLDGADAKTLLKNSNSALHHAKKEGPGSFQYYATQMNATVRLRLSMETELRRALDRDEFVLYYQPKVDLVSGEISGIEALLRWQSPERGLVAPDEFIPLLEETGLILPVSAWLLNAACRQVSLWQQEGIHTARIAINLCALQFRQPDFVSTLRDVIEKNGLIENAASIELELTESSLMKDIARTSNLLSELQEMGVRLSIDDFGTGYSCLSYLKHLPVNSLKIDQSFIRGVPNSRKDSAIVDIIIALGHSLGLNVIAEGVETVEQLSCLRKLKCNEAQGYLFSRPVPAGEMLRLLRSGVNLQLFKET